MKIIKGKISALQACTELVFRKLRLLHEVCPIMCKVYVIVESVYDLYVWPGMAARAYIRLFKKKPTVFLL